MGLFSIGRWKLRHLVLSWAGYWIALGVIALGPAIAAARHAAGLPDNTSDISLGFNNTVFNIVVREYGNVTYAAAPSIGAITFWLVVPPLLLWLFWVSRSRRQERPAELGQGSPPETATRRKEGAEVRRGTG